MTSFNIKSGYIGMCGEVMERHYIEFLSPYDGEVDELWALWFFDLGYHFKFSYRRGDVLVEDEIWVRQLQPFTPVSVEAAIQKKHEQLSTPQSLWDWFDALDERAQKRYLEHFEEQKLLFERYAPIVRRLVVA